MVPKYPLKIDWKGAQIGIKKSMKWDHKESLKQSETFPKYPSRKSETTRKNSLTICVAHTGPRHQHGTGPPGSNTPRGVCWKVYTSQSNYTNFWETVLTQPMHHERTPRGAVTRLLVVNHNRRFHQLSNEGPDKDFTVGPSQSRTSWAQPITFL